MKRPIAIYMILLALSIVVLFLLNLFLGSVMIPFESIWNILWGMDEGESVIWQNIIWNLSNTLFCYKDLNLHIAT